MLYRLPFTFTAVSIKKGHRKMEPHIFGDWALTEIPHVTADEAPVSMRWQTSWANKQVTHEARWFEEANWALAIPRDPRVPTPTYGHDHLAKLSDTAKREGGRFSSHLMAYSSATGQDFGNLNRFLSFSRTAPGRVDEYDPADLREVSQSDRQPMHDRLVRHASNLLFVDGQLWVRGKEPCYAVHDHNAGMVTIQNSVSDVPEAWCPSNNSFFRADRLDEAMDFAAERTGNPATAPYKIEILMPEAVLFDDEGFALKRSARHIVDKSFESMKNAPANAVRAWLAAREAGNGKSMDMEAVVSAVSEMSNYLKDEELRQIAEQAIRRWDFRPIGNEFPTP